MEIKYFVLKPKSKCKGDIYAAASRKALRAFANHIRAENEELSKELWEWADAEHSAELSK